MEQGAYAEMYEQEEAHWWFRGRRAVIAALLDRLELPGEVRILDAGCGTGRNLVELARRGRAVGVDPSPDAVEFCAKRGLEDVHCAGLEALPFADGEFGLVVAFDVVEHVHDDVAALSELRRVAAPRAALLLTVPAYQWMWSEHDVHLHHFRRYRLSLLSERATEAGWAVETATYFNTLLFPPAALARLAARLAPRAGHTDLDRTGKLANSLLYKPMQLEAALIARGARLPFGVSLAMVCRNPTSAPG